MASGLDQLLEREGVLVADMTGTQLIDAIARRPFHGATGNVSLLRNGNGVAIFVERAGVRPPMRIIRGLVAVAAVATSTTPDAQTGSPLTAAADMTYNTPVCCHSRRRTLWGGWAWGGAAPAQRGGVVTST